MNIELTHRKFLLLLLSIISIKFIALALYIHSGSIGLSPDEAQYWTWSQALDWGYYSKPPGIAWQIWLGTSIFGQTEFGIRFFSLIFAFFTPVLVYYSLLWIGLTLETAFLSALFMALTPIGFIGSILAITDVGMLFFWILSFYLAVRQIQSKNDTSWIGLAIGLGALFKWTSYLFWLFFLVAWWIYQPNKSISNLTKNIALSLIGLLPSVWWNMHHDWATFKHVWTTVQGGNVAHPSGNFLEFFGSQILLLSPILFFLFMLTFLDWMRSRQTSPAIFLAGIISYGSLILLLVASFFQKIQGNWGIFAYPTAFFLVGNFVSKQQKYRKHAYAGVFLSVVLMAFLLNAPIPYRMNPFKHNLGWTSLDRTLEKIGYDPNKHFLASDKYQNTSLLSFYSKEKKRAFFLNLHKIRNNQFSYWSQLNKSSHLKEGFFILVDSNVKSEQLEPDQMQFYEDELKKRFNRVEYVAFQPILYDHSAGKQKIVKGAHFFHCEDLKPGEEEKTTQFF